MHSNWQGISGKSVVCESVLKFLKKYCRNLKTLYICIRNREIIYHEDCNWSVRLGVRTPGFHPGNTGSIPVRTTSF